ncbi:MAG: hypothetical protein V1875_04665 [Candidatus Altiarchaeota archaeon]
MVDIPYLIDSIGYQMAAVNIVNGHGFVMGNLDGIDVYRIDLSKIYKQKIKPILTKPYNPFYTTPAYHFFLASVYFVAGVHPQTAKVVQTVLLAAAVSLLPWLGSRYWSNRGAAAGAFTAVLACVLPILPNPGLILSEPLSVFALMVWACAFQFFSKRDGLAWSFALGVLSGGLDLIKGYMGFIPIIFLGYVFFRFGSSKKSFAVCTLFILGCSTLIVPWEAYLYIKTGSFIVLARQFDNSLYGGNNAKSLETGQWNSDWIKDDFYSEMAKKDRIWSLALFWKENADSIPSMLRNKVMAATDVPSAFVTFAFRLIIASMMAYYAMGLLPKSVIWEERPRPNAPAAPLIFFLNIVIVTAVFFGLPRYTLPFMIHFTLAAVYFLLSAAAGFGRKG